MINNFFKNKSINKLKYAVRWGGYDNIIIPKMVAPMAPEEPFVPDEDNGTLPNYLTGNVPLTINFTDASTGDNLTYLWNFGDGQTSTQQNPTHTYVSSGNYTINLTATNNYGSDISTGLVTATSSGGSSNEEPPIIL